MERDALLAAAEHVIARDGAGATLASIAAEAGVTKPIVYARIGSQAELSNALAERLADRLVMAVNERVTVVALDRATLAGLFRVVFETLEAYRELFVYVTRGTGDDSPERALFLAGRSAEPLAALLAHHRAAQGDDPAVAEPWAYALVGMLNLTALWWMEHRAVTASTLADRLAELAWGGLRGRQQP